MPLKYYAHLELPVFQYYLGKPVPDCQTILGFIAARAGDSSAWRQPELQSMCKSFAPTSSQKVKVISLGGSQTHITEDELAVEQTDTFWHLGLLFKEDGDCTARQTLWKIQDILVSIKS